MVLTSQRAGLRKTGQDGGRWEYKLGVSAKRSGSVPIGPAHICLNLGLEAVGPEVLLSDFTRTTHDIHLCCSFRAELAELRCALCWGRHKGERDRGPLLGLNPSCSPLLVRTQCRIVYTRTSVPTEKRDSFTPRQVSSKALWEQQFWDGGEHEVRETRR